MAYAELTVRGQVDQEALEVVQVVEVLVELVEPKGLVELVALHLPYLFILYTLVNVFIYLLTHSLLILIAPAYYSCLHIGYRLI